MSIISAADYSTIKSKVDAVFGAGSGQNGYGQLVTSPVVLPGQRQTAAQWIALRNDMVKARQHQTGTNVGTSNSTDGNNLVTVQAGTLISSTLLAQYNNFSNVLQTNKFALNGVANYSDELLVTATRTTAWNGTITHRLTVAGNTSAPPSGNTGSSTGNQAANIRFFFNAGGTIRLSASITGFGESGSGQKGWTWNNMLTTMGTVVFNHDNTICTGTGTNTGLGWYDLLTTDQVVFTKTAPSGSYSSNLYRITARRDASSTSVTFTITFQDNAVGNPNFDENVTGTLTSTVRMWRPSGSNVSVLAPVATNDPTAVLS